MWTRVHPCILVSKWPTKVCLKFLPGHEAALDVPKTQREMTLKGVCDRSGAYDNARRV